MSVLFKHPFTCLIAGPTGSGKSYFVFRLLKNIELIDPIPERIVYCYVAWQEAFNEVKDVEFLQGLPQLDYFNPKQRTLLIVDDLMSECDKNVTDIFTRGSHHLNISILYIVQNLFDKGKHHRTISLNAHYLIVFKSPRDNSQITHLGKQMFPKKLQVVSEAFYDATSKPYGYLLFDFKQSTPEKFRLRTNIFPDETQFVYVPK